MAILQQIFGTPPLPCYEVNHSTTVIGRNEDCDIVIQSPAVSRRHARIVFDKERYFIEDLSSRNGTSVNGKPIADRVLLNDGDQVEVSTLPFTFQTQNSLAEASGSWGVKPKVISLTSCSSDDSDSIRRQIVTPGDRIASHTDPPGNLKADRIVGRMAVGDPGAGWPVTSNAAQKLNFSLRMLHSLQNTMRRDDLIASALTTLFDLFPTADRIAILLKDESSGELIVAAAVSRIDASEVQICLPVVHSVVNNMEGVLYVDHWKRPDSGPSETDEESLRSILAAPLIGLLGRPLGAVQLDSTRQDSPLNRNDMEMLVIINQVIAFGIEQVSRVEQEIQRAIIERSTEEAGKLQRCLATTTPDDVHGHQLIHHIIQTPDIAADCVEYLRLADGRTACVVIDVPGRGADATVMMALVSRLVVEAIAETGSAALAIKSMEKRLRQRLSDVPVMLSVGIMIVNPVTASVSVSVAGNCPLVMLHQGQAREITTEAIIGPPVGAERESYVESELQLDDNDLIVMFSDGVIGLTSPSGEVMKRNQIVDIVNRVTESPSHMDSAETFIADQLNDFRSDAPLKDDVAIAVVRRLVTSADGDHAWRMDAETQDI